MRCTLSENLFVHTKNLILLREKGKGCREAAFVSTCNAGAIAKTNECQTQNTCMMCFIIKVLLLCFAFFALLPAIPPDSDDGILV